MKLNQYDKGIKKWKSKLIKKSNKKPKKAVSPIFFSTGLKINLLNIIPYPITENKQKNV